MEPRTLGLLLSLLAGLSTSIGAGVVFFIKDMTAPPFAMCMAASGGIMVYVSLVELFATSVSKFAEVMPQRGRPELCASLSFFSGWALLWVFDFFSHWILELAARGDGCRGRARSASSLASCVLPPPALPPAAAADVRLALNGRERAASEAPGGICACCRQWREREEGFARGRQPDCGTPGRDFEPATAAAAAATAAATTAGAAAPGLSRRHLRPFSNTHPPASGGGFGGGRAGDFGAPSRSASETPGGTTATGLSTARLDPHQYGECFQIPQPTCYRRLSSNGDFAREVAGLGAVAPTVRDVSRCIGGGAAADGSRKRHFKLFCRRDTTESELMEIEEANRKFARAHYGVLRVGVFTALALTVHNFPEGLATFTSSLAQTAFGFSVAFAVAVHNIPEGFAVAVPLYYATNSRFKGFLFSSLSGLAEPLAGLIGYFVVGESTDPRLFACMFGIIAGIMCNLALRELLPSAFKYDPTDRYTSVCMTVAMLVMAATLVIFRLVGI